MLTTRRILLIIFLGALTIGCSRKKVIEATYENGNPKIVKYYHEKAGKPELEREEFFYENKQIKIEGDYMNEERSGLWKAWYENGTIWSEAEYKDGKRNGKGVFYHQNGIKYIEGRYSDDTRVGTWRFYDTTGVLTKEVNFDLVPNPQETDSVSEK
jgi:antitoxin component YwqK of YwqJK toxin-antitoxin module